MIEVRHLKAVAALADTGSVTRAAANLHLTQSALSHQLAALEDYFEVPLFERQQRPLKLTAAGAALLGSVAMPAPLPPVPPSPAADVAGLGG